MVAQMHSSRTPRTKRLDCRHTWSHDESTKAFFARQREIRAIPLRERLSRLDREVRKVSEVPTRDDESD